MSDDLITRLQVCAKWDPDQAEAIEVIQAQAAEIARLRDALATARWEGREEAAALLEQIAVKEINGECQSRLPRCVVTLSYGIATIRAKAKEGKP